MTNKIVINASIGLIEIEGDALFVREIYSDFRDSVRDLLAGNSLSESNSKQEREFSQSKKDAVKTKKRKAAPKRSSMETSEVKINADSPSLDKNLDTSGLPEFYNQFEPKNHPEKILIFMKFLIDSKGIQTPNTDQIFTCYSAVKEKPAAAFAQSFRDTSSKKNGYIDYNSPENISLTFIGNRHFDHDLKRKNSE